MFPKYPAGQFFSLTQSSCRGLAKGLVVLMDSHFWQRFPDRTESPSPQSVFEEMQADRSELT